MTGKPSHSIIVYGAGSGHRGSAVGTAISSQEEELLALGFNPRKSTRSKFARAFEVSACYWKIRNCIFAVRICEEGETPINLLFEIGRSRYGLLGFRVTSGLLPSGTAA